MTTPVTVTQRTTVGQALGAHQTAAPVVPAAGTVRPAGLDEVRITGGFWADRQRLNRDAIIPHIEHWETRVGWVANFDAVVNGTIAQTRTGREFADSDVYKLVESMAWEIGRTGDEELEARLQAIAERIAAAQQPDGYLNTRYGNPGQESRYSNLEWGHELYCYGHLIQAAVARLRTGHHDLLVDVALRAADHVCEVFGADGIQSVCGHPEIEPALVELSRATGDPRYLEQARLFLDRRGHHTLRDIEFGRSYFQDDVPIRDADVLRGHAVRALYLAAGAIDAGVDEGDGGYVDTIERQYARALQRRTYITGGMGSHHQDEAFGDDFELPPDRAYCETCAGVASVMVAWRLLLASGDLRYADVIERTLYNVVAASPSATGDAFFYTNPLQQRVEASEASVDEPSPRAHAQLRAPWFEVSCCPPNVARTFAQLATYVATHDDNAVQLLQYVPSDLRLRLSGGREVRLAVSTEYPYDGQVAVEVLDAPDDEWTLTLRIPSWAEGAVVEFDGSSEAAAAPSWSTTLARTGSRVTLRLPVAPRWSVADERVDAVRGTVAVQAGPFVMCAESVDLPGGADVDRLRVHPGEPLRGTPAGAVVRGRLVTHRDATWPYASALTGAEPERAGSAEVEDGAVIDVPLIPYHSWANRGPSTMRVWMPTA
jgi:DUF1680 family protein